VFSGVFIPEPLDRVGDKETGDTTMVDAQTLFVNMSLRSACFSDNASF